MNIQNQMNKKSAAAAQHFVLACVYILGRLKKKSKFFMKLGTEPLHFPTGELCYKIAVLRAVGGT